MKRDFLRGVLTGALLTAIVFLAAMLVRFGTLGGRRGAGQVTSLTDASTQRKLSMVQEIINDDFVRDPDGDELETYLFKGIAAGLDDRYANYYSREENEDVTRQGEGSYFGIGVVFVQEAADASLSARDESETAAENGNGDDAAENRNADDAAGRDGSEAVAESGNADAAAENRNTDDAAAQDESETAAQSGTAGSGLVSQESREGAKISEGREDSVVQVVIQKVYEDSPAEKAGLQPGDVLLQVNGKDMTGVDLRGVIEAVNTAFASDKLEVPFVFLRNGEEITFFLREAQIETEKVTYEVLEEGLGYIMIPAFDRVTTQQFRDAIAVLQGETELAALVIDVRNNPGGDLEVVTAMLDDLLDGCLLLTSRSRTGDGESISAEDGKLFDGEMAVLINGESASAAEVFAGTLQYYDTAVLVGENSYGKGTIQHTYTLFDGSAFKLTSEIYAIAGEKEIDGVGIAPDIEVEDADGKEAKRREASEDASRNIGQDPVLEKAIEILRATAVAASGCDFRSSSAP